MVQHTFSVGLVGLLVICGGLLVLGAIVAGVIALVRSTREGEGLSERTGEYDDRHDDSAPPAPPVR